MSQAQRHRARVANLRREVDARRGEIEPWERKSFAAQAKRARVVSEAMRSKLAAQIEDLQLEIEALDEADEEAEDIETALLE